jgi:hypothetical protein
MREYRRQQPGGKSRTSQMYLVRTRPNNNPDDDEERWRQTEEMNEWEFISRQ